jgi:hypothetical protein
LSNITAGTPEQIQTVVLAGVFPKLIELLSSSEFDIQKEAAWAVSNATSGGTPEQIMYLAQQGIIPPLCRLLQLSDVKVVAVALEGLQNILRTGKSISEDVLNRIITNISDCGGLSLIEDLQVCSHIYLTC